MWYQNVMMLWACYCSSYNMPALIRKGSPGAWSSRLIKFHKGPLFIFISIIWHYVNYRSASLCFLGKGGFCFCFWTTEVQKWKAEPHFGVIATLSPAVYFKYWLVSLEPFLYQQLLSFPSALGQTEFKIQYVK